MDEYLKVTDEIISKSKSYNKMMDTFRENWESPFTYLIKRGYIPAEAAKPDKLSNNAIRKMQKQYADRAGQSMDLEYMKSNNNFDIDNPFQPNTKDFRRDINKRKVCNTTTIAPPAKTTTEEPTSPPEDEDSSTDDDECEEYYDDVTECYYYDDESKNKTARPTDTDKKTTTASNNNTATEKTEYTTKCAPKVTTTTKSPPQTLPKCKPTDATVVDMYSKKNSNRKDDSQFNFQQNQLPIPYSQKEQRKAQKIEVSPQKDSLQKSVQQAAFELAQKIAENTVAEYSKNRSQLLSKTKSLEKPTYKIKRSNELRNFMQKSEFIQAERPNSYAESPPLDLYKAPHKNQQGAWDLYDSAMLQSSHSNYPHKKKDNSFQNTFKLQASPILCRSHSTQSDRLLDKSKLYASHSGHQHSSELGGLKDMPIFQASLPGHPNPTQSSRLQDKPIPKASHPGHPKPTQPSRFQDKPKLEDWQSGQPHPTQANQKQSFMQKLFLLGREKQQKASHSSEDTDAKDRAKDEGGVASKVPTKNSNPSKSNKELSQLLGEKNNFGGKVMSDLTKNLEQVPKSDDHFDDNKDDYFYDKPDSYIALNAVYVIQKKGDTKNQEPVIGGIKLQKITRTNATDNGAPAMPIATQNGKSMKWKPNPENNQLIPPLILSNDFNAGKEPSVRNGFIDFKKYNKPKKTETKNFLKPQGLNSKDLFDDALLFPTNYGGKENHINKRKETGFSKSSNSETQLSKANAENKISHRDEKMATDFLASSDSKRQTGSDKSVATVYDNQDNHLDWQFPAMHKETGTDYLNPMNLKSPLSKIDAEDKNFCSSNFENYYNKKTDTDFLSSLGSKSDDDFPSSSNYGEPEKYKHWQQSKMNDETKIDDLISLNAKSRFVEENIDDKIPYKSNVDNIKNYNSNKADIDFFTSFDSKIEPDIGVLGTTFYDNELKHKDWQSQIDEETAMKYLKSLKTKVQQSPANTEDQILSSTNFKNVGNYENEKIGTNFSSSTHNDIQNPTDYGDSENHKDWKVASVDEKTGTDFLNSKAHLDKVKTIAETFYQNNLKNMESNKNKQTGVDISSWDTRRHVERKIQIPTNYDTQKKHLVRQHSKIDEEPGNDNFNIENPVGQSCNAKTVDEISYPTNFETVENNIKKQMGADFLSSWNSKKSTDSKIQNPMDYIDEPEEYKDLPYFGNNKETGLDYLNSNSQSGIANNHDRPTYLTHFQNARNYRNEKKEANFSNSLNLKNVTSSHFTASSQNNNQENYKNWRSGNDFLNPNSQLNKANISDKVYYSTIFENIDNSENMKAGNSLLNSLDSKSQTGSSELTAINNDEQEKHTTLNDETGNNNLYSENSKNQAIKAETRITMSNPTNYSSQETHDEGLQLGTIVKVNNKKATGEHEKAFHSNTIERKFDVARSTDLPTRNNNGVGKDFLKLFNYDKFKFANTDISDTYDHSKDGFSKSAETMETFDFSDYSKPSQNSMETNDLNSQNSVDNINFGGQKIYSPLKPYDYGSYDNTQPWHDAQIQRSLGGQSYSEQKYTPSNQLSFSDSGEEQESKANFIESHNRKFNEKSAKNSEAINKKPHPQYYASEKILDFYRHKNTNKEGSVGHVQNNQAQTNRHDHDVSKFHTDIQAELKLPRAERNAETQLKLAPEYSDIVEKAVQNITSNKFSEIVPKIESNNARCEFGTY